MSKVQIVGSKVILSEVIEVLHSIGTIQIESVPQKIDISEKFISAIPLDRERVLLRERLDILLAKLKDILLLLPKPASSEEEAREGFLLLDITSDEGQRRIDDLYNEIKEVQKRRLELREELSTAERYERILKGFAPLITAIGDIRHLEVMGITIDKEKRAVLPLLKEEVERITEGRSEIFDKVLDEETIGVIIAYSRDFDTALKELLMGENISEITLPAEYAGLSFLNAMKEMIKRKEGIPRELHEIRKSIERLSLRWYHIIKTLIDTVADTIDEFHAVEYCAQTHYAFILSGWVPKSECALLSTTLRNRFGNKAVVREVEIAEEEVDEVPVSIKNPFFIRPFEVFMSVFPPPKYGTIDPTPFLAFLFPVFYGLILGDVGYGVIVLALSLSLKRRFREREFLKDIFTVFSICAMFSVIFGVLFGEFFGDLGEHYGMHPIIFDRARAVESFLILAVAIGVGHVLFGLLLAFVNSLQRGKMKHAIVKAATIAAVVALLCSIAVMAGYLPQTIFTPGILVLASAFVLLIVLEGIVGPLEIIGVVGNMLSYARIMAIGMASIILAIVANELGGMTGNIFLGIVVASLIHLINIALGVFSPTIHDLRLHYVEFFGKFFQPGGRKYVPFKRHK
ncbi:MAG: V-type ATP synthase subunit I [Thermodesulfobacteriota bacterium]